jgi:hypothetical protein
VADTPPPRRPPPHRQGRTGSHRRRLRLAAGHDPRDGEPERAYDRHPPGSRGLAPGQLVARQVGDPRRPALVGPSPERIDEPDRVVEVRLRPSRRRLGGIPFEESAEPAAQGSGGERDDPPHLIAPLASQRLGKLLDLPPRDPGQPPGFLGSEAQLDAHGRGIFEEPIPERRVDVQLRQRALHLG